jgi:hypothetical protein
MLKHKHCLSIYAMTVIFAMTDDIHKIERLLAMMADHKVNR